MGQYGWSLMLYLFLKYGDKERSSQFYTMQYRLAFPQFMNAFTERGYTTLEKQYLSCVHNRFFGRFCDFFGLAIVRAEKRKDGFLSDYFVRKSTLADEIFTIVDYS